MLRRCRIAVLNTLPILPLVRWGGRLTHEDEIAALQDKASIDIADPVVRLVLYKRYYRAVETCAREVWWRCGCHDCTLRKQHFVVRVY